MPIPMLRGSLGATQSPNGFPSDRLEWAIRSIILVRCNAKSKRSHTLRRDRRRRFLNGPLTAVGFFTRQCMCRGRHASEASSAPAAPAPLLVLVCQWLLLKVLKLFFTLQIQLFHRRQWHCPSGVDLRCWKRFLWNRSRSTLIRSALSSISATNEQVGASLRRWDKGRFSPLSCLAPRTLDG